MITVKAELANRLLDVDLDRARAELADLERLSRDALADVRRTVEGYRDLTLPGELARARQALRGRRHRGRLPNTAEAVPSDLRELFAWTVREGVTNVVRHSNAHSCTVTLDATSVRVPDDGSATPASRRWRRQRPPRPARAGRRRRRGRRDAHPRAARVRARRWRVR